MNLSSTLSVFFMIIERQQIWEIRSCQSIDHVSVQTLLTAMYIFTAKHDVFGFGNVQMFCFSPILHCSFIGAFLGPVWTFSMTRALRHHFWCIILGVFCRQGR